MYVYPSLPRHVASELYDDLIDAPLATLRNEASTYHPSADYYATGTRVPSTTILELSRQIRECADALGFPEPFRTRDAYTDFDHAVPKILFDTMGIVPADAADEGVWSFLSLVVLPDIAAWRYPSRARERMMGLPRNVFRRLWWRAYVLGSSDSDPTAVMGEDQLVAVMERPTIGGDPRLARSFCRAVMNALANDPGLPSMFLMRESAKRLTRLTPFICFGALREADLDGTITEIVSQASRSLRSDLESDRRD